MSTPILTVQHKHCRAAAWICKTSCYAKLHDLVAGGKRNVQHPSTYICPLSFHSRLLGLSYNQLTLSNRNLLWKRWAEGKKETEIDCSLLTQPIIAEVLRMLSHSSVTPGQKFQMSDTTILQQLRLLIHTDRGQILYRTGVAENKYRALS